MISMYLMSLSHDIFRCWFLSMPCVSINPLNVCVLFVSLPLTTIDSLTMKYGNIIFRSKNIRIVVASIQNFVKTILYLWLGHLCLVEHHFKFLKGNSLYKMSVAATTNNNNKRSGWLNLFSFLSLDLMAYHKRIDMHNNHSDFCFQNL